MTREAIGEALRLIFQGIETLKTAFPNRAFAIDGRLVGDVGEVIAALEYDVSGEREKSHLSTGGGITPARSRRHGHVEHVAADARR